MHRNRHTREEIIRQVRDWAESLDEPVRVYIFGSRHKGTNRKDSDVDIALESGEQIGTLSEFMAYWPGRRKRWEEQLKQLLGLEVDLQPYAPRLTTDMKSHLAEDSEIIFDSID